MAKSGNIRWDRVALARKRIAAGRYDDPYVLDKILSPRRLDRILSDFDACQTGDGHAYRDLLAEVLSKCLAHIVDVPLSRHEFPAAGGRGDIDLPLRTEALKGLPLWERWADKYDVRSIVIESKNEKVPASVEDAAQLGNYLANCDIGRLGILVARNGFSRKAMENMSAMARKGHSLIIPLAHEHVRQLAKASKEGPVPTMEYLRRRETLLLQFA